ncbi:hypothetical protein HHI36_008278 [Cryptolaemus montrouzieri]|uniref:Uncharacterized protein n=1 Tax=Cryptolaemus montrouzieri TaxID=559131 RepID=A0ABD2MS28_9CUCU
MEFLWNVKDIAIDEKMSYMEALKHEIKFVFNLRLNKKRTKRKFSPGASTEELEKNAVINRSRSLLQSSSSLYNINKIHVSNEGIRNKEVLM